MLRRDKMVGHVRGYRPCTLMSLDYVAIRNLEHWRFSSDRGYLEARNCRWNRPSVLHRVAGSRGIARSIIAARPPIFLTFHNNNLRYFQDYGDRSHRRSAVVVNISSRSLSRSQRRDMPKEGRGVGETACRLIDALAKLALYRAVTRTLVHEQTFF